MIDKIKEYLRQNNVDGVLVPKWDRFRLNPDPCDDFLRWATRFTGSYGIALITQDHAFLFTDSRYTIQAQKESPLIDVISLSKMNDVLRSIGSMALIFDPWLFSKSHIESYQKNAPHLSFMEKPLFLAPLWKDRPYCSNFSIEHYDFSGESSMSKCEKVNVHPYDYVLLTEPESICWLLNIRNSGKPYVPVVPCMAIMDKTGYVEVFLDADQIYINRIFENVAWYNAEDLVEILKERSSYQFLAAHNAPLALTQWIPHITFADSPIARLRAQKNPVEISFAQICHRRDGAAVTEFLHWFQTEKEARFTEYDAALKLESLRLKHVDYMGPSFPTIAASGENSAMVHYVPTIESSSIIKKGDVFLVDSGGQYQGATTDVTRTVVFQGKPKKRFKEIYTLVLKGHIALIAARFPKGTTGHQLDALARQFLWQHGLDYEHSTGHGVGNYLNVHEGPQSISKKFVDVALMPGMIVSIEPGYYKEGEFGVRLENLAYVEEGHDQFLQFNVLTFAPFDPNLILFSELTSFERQWLLNYHSDVQENLHYLITPDCQRFLNKVCLAYKRN